jgi:flagellar biosynthetic protein FliQ
VSYAAALSLGREAIFTALVVAAPMLVLGLITGVIISVFQTLTFIPKILVSALAILFFGPFMLAMLTAFMSRVFSSIPQLIK